MKTKFGIGCVILSLVIGCSQSKNKIYDTDLLKITVESDSYQKKTYYSQIFDSVKWIPIDNDDNCIIGNIAKVIFRDNRFYILDDRQQIVFALSETGKLIWKIDKRGNGPGEYRSLTDFNIDKDRIYLFDPRKSVLEYDLNGNFIKNYPLKAYGSSMMVMDETFYIHTCNYTSEEGDYSLLIMNDYGQNFKKGIPIAGKNLINKCVTFNQKSVFYRYNDKIRFYTPFSTKVYSIVGDSISIAYDIDFKNFNMPDNYFDNNTVDELKNTTYAQGFNSFWENDSFFYFEIKFNDEWKEILFSKNENKLTCGGFYDDLAYCFPKLEVVTEDYAIGFRSMPEIHKEYFSSGESRNNTMVEKIVKNTNEEDNPVLFVYYFKNKKNVKF